MNTNTNTNTNANSTENHSITSESVVEPTELNSVLVSIIDQNLHGK